jgi:hypothetical protein
MRRKGEKRKERRKEISSNSKLESRGVVVKYQLEMVR